MFDLFDCLCTADIDGSSGAIVAPSGRGIIATTKVSTGIYDLEMGTEAASGVAFPVVTTYGTGRCANVIRVDGTTWRVETFDVAAAGIARDTGFGFTVYRRPGLVGES